MFYFEQQRKAGKFDFRTDIGIFLGYSSISKAYKFSIRELYL